MNKEELINGMKDDHDIVLSKFRFYDDSGELYLNEKRNLAPFTGGNLEQHLMKEKNVFQYKGTWIYSYDWHYDKLITSL